ncbi:sodium pump decarboxylase, gamma subunit [Alkaliphilus metalliredigens QYMF]|uniref:Sodium pump decarboxylase, gamma subunit n=1 Tax=Alkaliphilus metalliredigens (strain QYMF) TaxID=293826 RepID=A6TT38_ALKMQ|nr:OadG family protein [Alkaliphilus metalliredigens]ABR49356.1 sodium pump decarboxylase, gamma subunit [Alkaliphilus metalliredigens QYMF]ABR50609.1 sodium pump decarboxylase, gamma subunit [Alkaliphilus metalliredigens QYMF]
MTLLEKMKVSIDQMTMAEKLGGSLQATVMGVSIVFVALMFLFLAITIMEKMLYGAEQKKTKKEVPVPVEATIEEAEEEDTTSDTELVAVITAAIAASLHTSTHNIVVRNIVRTSENTPAWARAGRGEQVQSRL